MAICARGGAEMTDAEQVLWLSLGLVAVCGMFFAGLCALDKVIDWMGGWR